jgi:hypothetical protein
MPETGAMAPLETEDAGESETFTKIQETLEKLAILFDPVIEGFNRLKTAAEPVIANIGEGLKWFYDNVLVPYGTWVISEAVPSFMNLLSGALNALNPILEAFKPLGQWLWENFLQPAGEWAGEALLNALNWLADVLTRIGNWMSEHKGVIEVLAIIVGSFAAAWGLVNIAVGVWNTIGAIATGVTSAFGAAVAFLTSPIGLVVLAIGAVIAIVVLLIKYWDQVKAAAVVAWEWIKSTWQVVAKWFNTKVIQPIVNAFKSLKTIIISIWDGIWGGIKSVVNSIIGGINTLIKGLNKLHFDIPDWVPSIGGKSFGINIPLIPKLATGTNYVPQDMFAYLHEGEAVVPKKYNPAAGGGFYADELEQAVYRGMMSALRIAQASTQQDNRELVLKIDNTVLARMQLPALRKEAERQGFNLILRPQGV